MKITVINNRSIGGAAVQCVDGIVVIPGSSHEMPGRNTTDLIFQMAVAETNQVIVLAEIDGTDREPINCVMKNPADPAGGADTLAGVGFDLKTLTGAAANVAPTMYMGVFDDADCTIPAVHANLSTATTGTIVSGSGTALIEVTPSSTGVFACSVNDTTDEKVYLKAWPKTTSYVMDTSSIDDVTFTP